MFRFLVVLEFFRFHHLFWMLLKGALVWVFTIWQSHDSKIRNRLIHDNVFPILYLYLTTNLHKKEWCRNLTDWDLFSYVRQNMKEKVYIYACLTLLFLVMFMFEVDWLWIRITWGCVGFADWLRNVMANGCY